MIRIHISEPDFDKSLEISAKLVSSGKIDREDITSIEDDLVEISLEWTSDEFIQSLKNDVLSDFPGLEFEKAENKSVDLDQDGKPVIPNPIENITYQDVPNQSSMINVGELAADSVSSVSVDMFSKFNDDNKYNNMKLKDKSKRSFNDSLENENTEMTTVETVTEADQEQVKSEQLEETANVNGDGLSSVSGQVEDVVKSFSKVKRNTKAYASAIKGLRRIFTENPDLAQDALDVINEEYEVEPDGDPVVDNLGEFAKRIQKSKSNKTSKFAKYRKAEPKRLFSDEYGDEAAENYVADVEAVVTEYPDIQGEVLDFVKKKFNLEEVEDESNVEPVTPFTEEEIGEPEVTESDEVVEKTVEFSSKAKNAKLNSKSRRNFNEDEPEVVEETKTETETEEVEGEMNPENLMFTDEEIGDDFDPESVELFNEDGDGKDDDESEPETEDDEDEKDGDEVDGQFSSKKSRGQFSKTNKSESVAEFRQRELQAMLK